MLSFAMTNTSTYRAEDKDVFDPRRLLHCWDCAMNPGRINCVSQSRCRRGVCVNAEPAHVAGGVQSCGSCSVAATEPRCGQRTIRGCHANCLPMCCTTNVTVHPVSLQQKSAATLSEVWGHEMRRRICKKASSVRGIAKWLVARMMAGTTRLTQPL